jgi:hypothetical protein
MPTTDEILSFSLLIEKKALDLRCSHIDAILEYCKETGLEIEVASSMISAKLKSTIRDEAHSQNMLKKEGARLPI